MPDSSQPHPIQSAVSQVNAHTISVGNITQEIYYQQRPKALSTTINSGLPPIQHWQTRPQEAMLHDVFANPQVRLVGLYAAAGYGKSALAVRVYGEAVGFQQKLWANFQEPVSFDVFGRWVIQQVLGAERYAQVRELYERDTPEELAVKALNLLDQGRYLVVWDNLETLFQSSDLWQPYGYFVAEWLGRTGASTLLLTSQYRLELPTAAWRWEALGGLSEEQGIALLKAQQIEGSEADLRSFVNAAAGHPLLLQLAASWLLRQQLDDGDTAAIARLQQDDVTLLREIKELHRGDTEACVGAVLDRAFTMLHPQELQVLLWRLSVLRVGFGVAMAQAMAAGPVTVAELRRLARWSFLVERRQGEAWEFEFLPLIQRYLRLGARDAGELTRGHERAIAFYDSHRQPWTGKLEDCRSQFESVYHCCELGRHEDAKRVMDSCVLVLDRQGHWRSLVPIYEKLTAAWEPADEAETQSLGSAWTRLGNTYQSLGCYGEAIAAHQQAQQRFQSIAFRQGEAASLGNLGIAYRSLGQYQRAIEFLQQHNEIAREINDRNGEANSLGNLGNVYYSLGQYQRAIEFHQQSLEIAREINDRNGEANSLGNLGNAYYSLGQYQRAIEVYQQHNEIAREIGDRRGEANSLFNMAIVLQKLKRRSEALQHYQQAQHIYKELQLEQDVNDCQHAIDQLQKRFRFPWWGWFLIGVVVVLAIAWLFNR